jgi:hypothetical protein
MAVKVAVLQFDKRLAVVLAREGRPALTLLAIAT